MPKSTPKHRSESVFLAEVELRRRAKVYAAVSDLALEDERFQCAWRDLLGAALAVAGEALVVAGGARA